MRNNYQRAAAVASAFLIASILLVPTAPNGGEGVWMVGLLISFLFAWATSLLALWLGDSVVRLLHDA